MKIGDLTNKGRIANLFYMRRRLIMVETEDGVTHNAEDCKAENEPVVEADAYNLDTEEGTTDEGAP